jgi:hypothetical protein
MFTDDLLEVQLLIAVFTFNASCAQKRTDFVRIHSICSVAQALATRLKNLPGIFFAARLSVQRRWQSHMTVAEEGSGSASYF